MLSHYITDYRVLFSMIQFEALVNSSFVYKALLPFYATQIIASSTLQQLERKQKEKP